MDLSTTHGDRSEPAGNGAFGQGNIEIKGLTVFSRDSFLVSA